LLKKFQKSCQSDNISISDVLPLRAKFVESLENCKNNCLADGWEHLFLNSAVLNGNEVRFYGIKLMKSVAANSFKFTSQHRQQVIRSLINHVNMRIDLDASLHSAIQPLVSISSAAQQHDLKTCHAFVIPDLDHLKFSSEYLIAAELLKDVDSDTPMTNLQELEKRLPDGLHTIKTALARLIAIKPHSADVERLISE
jgi:hypothetical protein